MKNVNKISTAELAAYVEEDGLEWCLKGVSGEDFDDPQLGALWEQACDLLDEIQDMLDEASGDAPDDDAA